MPPVSRSRSSVSLSNVRPLRRTPRSHRAFRLPIPHTQTQLSFLLPRPAAGKSTIPLSSMKSIPPAEQTLCGSISSVRASSCSFATLPYISENFSTIIAYRAADGTANPNPMANALFRSPSLVIAAWGRKMDEVLAGVCASVQCCVLRALLFVCVNRKGSSS